ncbi:chorismate-binding protein [Pilimelia columellifera]
MYLAPPPAAPELDSHGLRERARWQWRLGDPGDPLSDLCLFLADQGIPVDDLARPGGAARPGAAFGAAVFVSAAASACAIGAPPGRATPAPAVPDIVAIAYDRTRRSVPTPTGTFTRKSEWRVGHWTPSWTSGQHADAVDAVRAAIARGDVYQANVVGHSRAPYHGEPDSALNAVAGLAGARYGGALAGPGWAIATASPETLVAVAAGRASTRPIKGTRPATAAGRAELLASAKERAEHIMIVDLERNDLAAVARTGSVVVDELFTVRRWCDLWQAESVVTAALADGVGLAELLRALAPGGSVTGAPKRAALAQIAALEPVGRGASMGAIGWISPGQLDLGLSIRTVAVDATHLHLWAGGGITWDSEPAAEVAEAAAKAAPIMAALAAG